MPRACHGAAAVSSRVPILLIAVAALFAIASPTLADTPAPADTLTAAAFRALPDRERFARADAAAAEAMKWETFRKKVVEQERLIIEGWQPAENAQELLAYIDRDWEEAAASGRGDVGGGGGGSKLLTSRGGSTSVAVMMRSANLGREERQRWLGGDLATAMTALEKAMRLDPTRAPDMLDLGRLWAIVGHPQQARACLAAADAAIIDRSAQPGLETALGIAREMAWLDRDAGRWADGLPRVEAALALAPDDVELRIVRGLLLAGAGRFSEANAAARELGAISARGSSWNLLVNHAARSDYAARWIEAMAWVQQGDLTMATFALGKIQYDRPVFPFQHRYWHDIGLVHELAGRAEEAASCYGLADYALPYTWFFPQVGLSVQPRVLGLPDPKVPFYTAKDGAYVAGSLFAYAAQVSAEASVAGATDEGRRLAALADDAFAACEARGIRVTPVRSLRGRLHYALGDTLRADADLVAACDSMRRSGRRDATTFLTTGMLRLRIDRPDLALPYLREAALADTTLGVAWRTLGIAWANAGRPDSALVAFNRGVAVEPKVPASWYNRGLFHFHERHWDASLTDLAEAQRLAPDDRRIAEALGRAQWAKEHPEAPILK